MQKVESLLTLHKVIQGKQDLYYTQNGRLYKLDVVAALNMKLIEILTMIKEGTLYYNPES